MCSLSVIIPVKNAEKYIGKCLETLLCQDVNEIIVVNDHSRDNSSQVIRKYTSDSRILYTEAEEYGVSAARNVGLSFASGDIIGFCDADDIVESTMASTVKAFFSEHEKASILVTGYHVVDNSRGEVHTITRKNGRNGYWKRDAILKKVICDSMGFVWNKYYRRNVVDDIRFDRELRLCEDTEFCVKAMLGCRDDEIYVTDVVTYNYVQNPESVTNDITKFFDHKTGELLYLPAFLKMLNSAEIPSQIHKYIEYTIFVFCIDTLTKYNVDKENAKTMIEYMHKYRKSFLMHFSMQSKENIKRVFRFIFRMRNGRSFIW